MIKLNTNLVKDKPVTITTIAKELGLSHVTISNVLSGQAKKRKVSDRTALKVRQTAKRLGYVPNHWARSLKRNKTGIISVLFPDLRLGWADTVMKGIMGVLGPTDYTPIISLHGQIPFLTHGDNGYQRKEIVSILQRRDEGVICHPINAALEDYLLLINAGIPVTFIGALPEDMTCLENVNSVTWDCEPAAKTAVQHLIQTGRQRIGFFGGRNGVQSDNIRYNAYVQALEEAGLEVNKKWITWGPTHAQSVVEQMESMFFGAKERPDAFFALNDAGAMTLLNILGSLDLRVPEDVAVIGMGDLPIARHHTTNLTTMHEPLEEMGREAVKVVLTQIEKSDRTPIHRKISCKELKIRQTA